MLKRRPTCGRPAYARETARYHRFVLSPQPSALTHSMLQPITLHCPYCGEAFETQADTSAGSQRYVEDCAVCCRPIEVRLQVDGEGGLLGVDAGTDRD